MKKEQKSFSQSKLNYQSEKRIQKQESNESDNNLNEHELKVDKEKKIIKEYQFQEKWFQDYLWLKLESRDQTNKKLMYCTYCEQYKNYIQENNISENVNNSFIQGSNRFRSIALKEHAESQSHQKAVNYISKKNKKGINIFEMSTRNIIKSDLFKPLFVSYYYICKNQIALNNYPKLVDLFGYLNIQSTENYLNNAGGKEILYCISNNIKQQLINDIRHSLLPIGIALDTKVNRTNQKIMAISIKYINRQYDSKETFIALVELEQKNSETIYIQLVKILEDFQLLDVLHFISTDGEITLTSYKNGVMGKMLQKLPWLNHIHCRAHIANLGLSDIIKNFDILKTNNKIIYKICKVFKSNKQRKLQLLDKQQEKEQGLIDNSNIDNESNIEQEVQTQKTVIISQPLEIRWISYLPSAQKIIQLYDQIYQEILKIKKQKYIELLQQISKLNFIYFIQIHTMILKELNYLIKDLQSSNLNLEKLEKSYELCREGLQDIQKKITNEEQKFYNSLVFKETSFFYKGVIISQSSIEQLKEELKSISQILFEIISSLLQALQTRFSLISVISNLKIFNIKQIKNLPNVSLVDKFGENELLEIIKYYQPKQQQMEEVICQFNQIDFKELLAEYQSSKQFIYRNKSQENYYILSSLNCLDKFQNIKYFYFLHETLILTSVFPERIFSKESLVKTKIRNNLDIETINQILNVDYNGPNIQQFDFSQSIIEFKNMKQRNYI